MRSQTVSAIFVCMAIQINAVVMQKGILVWYCMDSTLRVHSKKISITKKQRDMGHSQMRTQLEECTS